MMACLMKLVIFHEWVTHTLLSFMKSSGRSVRRSSLAFIITSAIVTCRA